MKHTLIEAKHEILRLRRENEILSAKVEMIDLFGCLLHTQPARREQGMSVDVAWQLQQEVDKIEAEEKQLACKHRQVTRVENGCFCADCGREMVWHEEAQGWV